MDQQMLVSLLSDLGSLGFILWMTHQLTTKTIPRLAHQFEDGSEKQRQDFKAILREQREMFEDRAKREEELFSAALERLSQAIERAGDGGDH